MNQEQPKRYIAFDLETQGQDSYTVLAIITKEGVTVIRRPERGWPADMFRAEKPT